MSTDAVVAAAAAATTIAAAEAAAAEAAAATAEEQQQSLYSRNHCMHNMHDTFGLTVQDTENQGWQKAGPVQSGVPRHWGSVRCGCIEGVLATAILAGQHPDVWDAAGLLLREHYK